MLAEQGECVDCWDDRQNDIPATRAGAEIRVRVYKPVRVGRSKATTESPLALCKVLA